MQKYIEIAEKNQEEFNFFLKKVFPYTMKWEGGGKLHNVAGDSGGWTIYGIAWNKNSEYFHSFEDFKNITEEHAAMFAFANYYLAISAQYLKSNVKLLAFDMAYNLGTPRVKPYIQECAGVVADGIIGKNTIANMDKVTIECLQAKRVSWYNLLNKQAKFKKFYDGWMNRANDILKITKTN